MRSGASGVACLDPSFAVLYSALSIIAPSVNVLRRTRRKPSTIPRRCTGGRYQTIYGGSRESASLPTLPVLTFFERAAPDAPETIDDPQALHRRSLSDNLRRLARERVPTRDFDPH